ncbi:hypothetical protein P5Y53_20275 [Dyella jiangningensis]|uniref:hypothetical protein n=1 Tax=Dyella jiangningensis TaxID=1379159 RepID=UPI00240F2CB5|nr:hypothetical protein [Dyella jiangningensis]MDG2540024.1 hypothetical protein [Dyella jiangningensis]
MLLKMRGAGHADGFALWRIVAWLMLLLAAYGCLQYAVHGEQVWGVLKQLPPGNDSDAFQLRKILAWDVGYFVIAFGIVVICAGAILRQAWARPALQVASILLALGWGVAGGLMLLSQWREFSQGVAMTNAQAPLDPASLQALDHVRRSFVIAMAAKAAAVPVLLWLAWWLARPSVKAGFHELPRKRSSR